jgi:hypothetical protein
MTGVYAGFWCGQLRERDQMKDLGVDDKIVLNVMRRHELD